MGASSPTLKQFMGLFKDAKLDKGTVLTFSAAKGKLVTSIAGKQARHLGRLPAPGGIGGAAAALGGATAAQMARPRGGAPSALALLWRAVQAGRSSLSHTAS